MIKEALITQSTIGGMGYISSKLADIGISVSKNRFKDKVDEDKLKESLIIYVEQNKKYNEICSLSEEIDFQGLVEYIENNLLQDVEKTVFSDNKDIRKNARAAIIEKASDYCAVKGYDDSNRVTKLVSECIEIIKSYYRKKIDIKEWLLVDEIKESINDAKDEIEQKFDNGIDRVISTIQTTDSFYMLSKKGDYDEIEKRIGIQINEISYSHPLYPDYEFSIYNNKLFSIPKSKEAIRKHPPHLVCSGEVTMDGNSISELNDEIFNYADRHQLNIIMDIQEVKKMLGDVEDPIQHEAESLVGSRIVRYPKPFPDAFPCEIMIGETVVLKYIELRTEEILDDGTYIVSNKEQENCAIRVKIEFNFISKNRIVNYSGSIKNASTNDMLIFTKMMYMASKGGIISINNLKSGRSMIVGKVYPHKFKTGFASGEEEIDFLERICEIEQYFGCRIIADGEVNNELYKLILYLSDLIRGEKIKKGWKELYITCIYSEELKKEIENIGENYFALGAEREFRVQVFNQRIDITIHSVWTMAKIKEYNRIIKLMDYVNEGDPIKIILESNNDGRHIDSLEPIKFAE